MTGESGVLAAAFEATPGNAAVLDAAGDIIAVNRGWREFGRDEGLTTPDDAVGTNYVDACRGHDDEWATVAAEGFKALLSGNDDRFTLEYPCHSPDEKRWFLLRAVRFDHDGELYVLVSHLDITDRKEAELEVRRRTKELEDVVLLLAHDVRNPLGAAMGWLEAIEPAGESERKALDRAERSLSRIEEVVSDALTFMRADTTSEPRQRVDVGQVARDIWADLDTAGDELVVEGDVEAVCHPELFRHLLENLLKNALQHGGDTVTVTVGTTDDGFFVADDGAGIPTAHRDRLFEKGFTTSATGTGFGLAIVESVVDRHGWEIAADESEAGGARFDVRTRPAYGASVEPTPEHPLSEQLRD